MDKKRRIPYFILAGVLLAALAGGVAYREFYRTKPSGAELRAEMSMTAAQLTTAFAADDRSASATYAGHAIEVDGMFKESDLSDTRHPVIVLADSGSTTSLRFSLDSSFHADLSALKPGSPIRMKGICIGFQPDDMGLGADILFDRSIIISPNDPKP